ncbi:MAG TPA: hypothetical protein PLK80_13055 [bacterium]|nr:hypothetical protein [bacterium]
MKIRVKFGKNPYSNRFTCGRCREPFERGGFFVGSNTAAMLWTYRCVRGVSNRAEGVIDLSAHSASHPIGLA